MAKKEEVKKAKRPAQGKDVNKTKNVKSAEGKTYQQRIDFDEEPEKKKEKKDHTFAKSATPYILILLGVIFLICLFTVHILGLDEGVGIIGSWI